MTDADYRVVIAALSEAARVFARHEGSLSSGDLRTRSLLSIAEKEAARSLLETISRTHRREVAEKDGR